MNTRARWLVAAALALSSFAPNTLLAQDGGWTFRGAGEFGAFFSTRDLAKNVGGIGEVQTTQVNARLDLAMAVGGGVEAVMPGGRTIFRGIVRTTVNGIASAHAVQCQATDNVGALCIPREAGARHTSIHGEVVFVQGRTEDRFRQNFVLGVGFRSYQFTVEACNPDANLNQDFFVLCELVTEMYSNQAAVQPFIQFGFGMSMDAGPVTFSLRVDDMVGRYDGGSGNAAGDFQNDVYAVAGMSFRVR